MPLSYPISISLRVTFYRRSISLYRRLVRRLALMLIDLGIALLDHTSILKATYPSFKQALKDADQPLP